MRTQNFRYLLEASAAHVGDKFCDVVANSIEVGVVVPSILRDKLAKAGFYINQDEDQQEKVHGFKKLDHLYRVLIHDKDENGAVVAMGASDDFADALLHACLGYVQERDVEKFGCIISADRYANPNPEKIDGITVPTGFPMDPEKFNKIKEHLIAHKQRKTTPAKQVA